PPPMPTTDPNAPGQFGTPSSSFGTPTTQELDDSKQKDSGRGLEWVYFNAEGGFEQLGLKTFNVDRDNFTAGFVDTSAAGGVVGAGAGLRLIFITIGPRARLGFFPNYQLYSLGGEVGLHIPLGAIEPRIDLGFGWVGLGSFKSEVSGAGDALAIHGWYGRVGGGLDVYLGKHFSMGRRITWELLGLTRPGVSPDQIAKIKAEAGTNPAGAQADALQFEGTSYGSALAITGALGLHF